MTIFSAGEAREPFISDPAALSLMAAVRVSALASGDLRGPERRRLCLEEIVTEAQRHVKAGAGTVDSNHLPKEEPSFNGALLAAVTLVDVCPFLFDPFRTDRPFSKYETRCLDIIFAVILETGYGLTFREEGGDATMLDAEFVRSKFGSAVLSHLEALVDGARALDDAARKGESPKPIDPVYHDAVAALMASRLRLAMRTVGEGLFGVENDRAGRPLLGPYRGGALGEIYGVASGKEYLERHAAPLRLALELDGLDGELKDKIGVQLLLPVTAAAGLHAESSSLVGKNGTIPVYQNMLDLVRLGFEYTHPFAMVLGGYFELARYAERSRRRDGEPLLLHSLRVESSLLPLLGGLTKTLWRAAIFHDYIEDNIWDTGHPGALIKRAGLAALVAFELSDPESRGKDDVEKARRFAARELTPEIQWAGRLYGGLSEGLGGEERFVAAASRPANPEIPYSAEGAILKLVDFMDTMEAGLCRSERMSGEGWGQSGKRIGLHMYKEKIIGQLFRRLVSEHRRLEEQSGLRVSRLLRRYADTSGRYAMKNLDIACAERGIADVAAVQGSFFDEGLDGGRLEERLGPMFAGVIPPYDEAMAVSLERLVGEYRPRALELRRLAGELSG